MKVDGRGVLGSDFERVIKAAAIIESRGLREKTGVFGKREFGRPTAITREAKEGLLITQIIQVSRIGGVKDVAPIRGNCLKETERRIRPDGSGIVRRGNINTLRGGIGSGNH